MRGLLSEPQTLIECPTRSSYEDLRSDEEHTMFQKIQQGVELSKDGGLNSSPAFDGLWLN